MAWKPMATRNEIAQIAESFRLELERLQRTMDWPDYAYCDLELRVHLESNKCTWKIRCDGLKLQPVCGSDLGVVMDEVYRRLGYEHREQGRIETSMSALPAPSEEMPISRVIDDEIPF